MGCVREGKVRVGVLKAHSCYDDTLFSITFEPVIWFWCFNLGFEAHNVYFKMELSFNYLVGPHFKESAEKHTELSRGWECLSCKSLACVELCLLPGCHVKEEQQRGWIAPSLQRKSCMIQGCCIMESHMMLQTKGRWSIHPKLLGQTGYIFHESCAEIEKGVISLNKLTYMVMYGHWGWGQILVHI